MPKKRKKVSEQVIVITGASSGIGLVTARMAAERGARVVLAARNEDSLEAAVRSIGRDRALAVPTDVADAAQVAVLAQRAIGRFGAFDTWINCAAVSMYGRVWDISLFDAKRQMDVDFWGQVHGSLAALHHFRERGDGGIVNVTSCLADRAIPLQGYYCAAKHATKAFTDTLRMEIESEGLPIAVTQVKPSSIDTPFFEKARSQYAREPRPVPPVYAPEIVARVVLASCERPRRDVVVGGMGKLLTLAQGPLARLGDKYLERWAMENAQLSEIPTSPRRDDNLWHPVADDGGERGRTWTGRTKGTSLYTWLAMHGGPFALAVLAGMLVPALATTRRRRTSRGGEPSARELVPEAARRMEEDLPVVPT
jgi:NAD(P)-dependent dehydrogenase (short-subunit alcohol dehydrogenase family)